MDHRHDFLAIGCREHQGVRRLRIAQAVKRDAPEVLFVFRRHAAGLGESQVVETGPVARPREARELHVVQRVIPIGARVHVAHPDHLPIAPVLGECIGQEDPVG